MSMQAQRETGALPTATPPGEGLGPGVSPSSYLLHRNRREMTYQGLVDPISERLTVKKPLFADAHTFAIDVLRAARSHEMGKVLLYASEQQWQPLLHEGFDLEGILDSFFMGHPAYIMGYLLTNERRTCGDLTREQFVVESALTVAPESPPPLPDRYRLVPCGPEMASELAVIYKEIFSSFPTPLHEPDFVRELITSGAGIFRAVKDGERIASVAAAELEAEFGAAEITNCATRPAHRGEGLMQILIQELEQHLERRQITTWYSVARSSSLGMNRALRKAGYGFRGRLRGNSHIMGGYEDMHLWVKLGRAGEQGH